MLNRSREQQSTVRHEFELATPLDRYELEYRALVAWHLITRKLREHFHWMFGQFGHHRCCTQAVEQLQRFSVPVHRIEDVSVYKDRDEHP